MSSTLLVIQGLFANCSLLVFSLPQCVPDHQAPTCGPLARATTSCPTSPVVLQEFPCPTLPHQLSCKSSHVLHYLTSCPARVLTSYTTSPVVLQEFSHPTLPHQLSCKSSHILHHLTSCPTRVSTSYLTSPVVPQEFPRPTLPHQSSCKSSHVLHYLPVVLQKFPHPTLPYQSSRKNSHILHYLTSRPTKVPTSYTTSPVVPQEFPCPTLPHQLSCKSYRLSSEELRICDAKSYCICELKNCYVCDHFECYLGSMHTSACVTNFPCLHASFTLCNILACHACSLRFVLLCDSHSERS